jgi:hypothetical protein
VKCPAFQTLIDKRGNERHANLVDANMTQIIGPAGQGFTLPCESTGTFALHFGFFKISRAIIPEDRFTANGGELTFSSLVSLNFERFAGSRDILHWLIVGIAKWKTARRFLSVATLNPKLSIIAIPSNIEAGDSAVARIARGNKLGPMVTRHSTREAVSTGAMADFVALKSASLPNSSTNSSTTRILPV